MGALAMVGQMVSRSYLVEQPGKPGKAKLVVDQALIPRVIDQLHRLEMVLARIARRTRERPLTAIAACFAVGWLVGRQGKR